MSQLANIWNHPKTSAAGLLIAIVTVSGVLGQQGVTLGHVGTCTWVTFVSSLATALLGLLARDPAPDPAPSQPSTTKLGACALIALILPLQLTAGCNGVTVAQDIVNWTPALQNAVASVDSAVALLAPADAPILAGATAGFDAASNLLVAQARAYLASPSPSTLAALQSQIVVLQQQVNSALLQAVRIVNPNSQQHAVSAIQAVAAITSSILALIQSISSKAAIAQMAAHSPIKISTIRPYVDRPGVVDVVARHYNESIGAADSQVARGTALEVQSGF